MLTGFLGSGKTTLLSRFLASPGGARTAVLVNELGEVALDHLLLERIDQDVSLLPAGCVCCAIGGELERAFERVLAHAPERIVLETTGLADPAPVLHALAASRALAGRIAFGGVVTTLDAARGLEVLDAQPEARFQLELADRVVLTKLDIGDEEPASGLRERLALDHPSLEVLEARDVESAFSPAGAADTQRAKAWMDARGATDPHDAVTQVVELPSPADADALLLWLRVVTMFDGPKLLRVKGIVQTAEGYVVLQSAQRVVSPPRHLACAPEGWSGSRLVLISRGLPARALAAITEAAIAAATGAR